MTNVRVTVEQLDYITKLCEEKNLTPPDPPLDKDQASRIIGQLQAGTYEPAAWRVPF